MAITPAKARASGDPAPRRPLRSSRGNTIFATVSAVLGGWVDILGGVAATAAGQLPNAGLYRGIAESLTVGLVCFGLLAAAWFLVAVGMLRRAVSA